MTLPLPSTVQDPNQQEINDTLARVFPLSADKLGKSAKELFPQLVTPAARKEAFGSKTVTWPGATNFAGIVEIAHGLGVVPASISLTVTATNISAFLPPNAYLSADPTSTVLKVQVWANGAVTAGKTAIVYWRAIG